MATTTFSGVVVSEAGFRTGTTGLAARLVAGGSATTLTVADHEGKTILLDTLAGTTITLPAATGSGAKFRFVVSVVNTSNSHVIEVADATDIMYGNIIANSTGDTPDLAQPWPTAADSDTITLNGTTTGGLAIGDWIEVEDIKANAWAVTGVVTASGTEATPFSAAVS